MKYIPAEKLIAEIKRLDKENKELLKSGGSSYQDFLFGVGAGYADINKIIDSLQQEQPEPSNNLVDVDAVREDFITQVYRVLDADPTNDRANAIIDAFDSLPTIYLEQPEVDLDNHTIIKEIKKCGCSPNEFDIARHFYELARQKYEK